MNIGNKVDTKEKNIQHKKKSNEWFGLKINIKSGFKVEKKAKQ